MKIVTSESACRVGASVVLKFCDGLRLGVPASCECINSIIRSRLAGAQTPKRRGNGGLGHLNGVETEAQDT